MQINHHNDTYNPNPNRTTRDEGRREKTRNEKIDERRERSVRRETTRDVRDARDER